MVCLDYFNHFCIYWGFIHWLIFALDRGLDNPECFRTVPPLLRPHTAQMCGWATLQARALSNNVRNETAPTSSCWQSLWHVTTGVLVYGSVRLEQTADRQLKLSYSVLLANQSKQA